LLKVNLTINLLGKGLRSIVNKILVQMCAKVGGEPWAVDFMPFTKVPTMICSLKLSKTNSHEQIITFCATTNRTFTKYVSLGTDVKEDCIEEMMRQALHCFKDMNKLFPQHVIIIQDGIAPSQARGTTHNYMNQIKSIDIAKEIKFTYLMINKKSNVKIFSMANGDCQNPTPGTVADNLSNSDKINDFYLVSQSSTQGMAQPSHYYVAYDDTEAELADLQLLVYKYTYLYYNWTGSIKAPAICQYAKKMAILLGEKISEKNQKLRFINDKKIASTLYYI
jgi:aubergine-like protein